MKNQQSARRRRCTTRSLFVRCVQVRKTLSQQIPTRCTCHNLSQVWKKRTADPYELASPPPPPVLHHHCCYIYCGRVRHDIASLSNLLQPRGCRCLCSSAFSPSLVSKSFVTHGMEEMEGNEERRIKNKERRLGLEIFLAYMHFLLPHHVCHCLSSYF